MWQVDGFASVSNWVIDSKFVVSNISVGLYSVIPVDRLNDTTFGGYVVGLAELDANSVVVLFLFLDLAFDFFFLRKIFICFCIDIGIVRPNWNNCVLHTSQS